MADRARTAGRSGQVAFAVAVLAVAVSAYLTIEHFSTSVTFACPESATINCAKVTTSSWSHVGPIPVAVAGLAYFVAMAALCSPLAWRRAGLTRLREVAAGIGVVTVVYLVWIELFRVNAVCLWCTVVHICAVGLFAAVLWHATAALESD